MYVPVCVVCLLPVCVHVGLGVSVYTCICAVVCVHVGMTVWVDVAKVVHAHEREGESVAYCVFDVRFHDQAWEFSSDP